MKTHNHRCYKCEFESEDKGNLKKHERNEHDLFNCKDEHEGGCNSLNTEAPIIPQAATLICDQCGDFFEEADALNLHIMTTHKDKQPDPIPTSCDQCSYVAEDVPSLIKHIRTKHNPLSCNNCKYEATDREDTHDG